MSELARAIAETAEEFVEGCRERTDDGLDYSEASLAIVDELLAEAHELIDDERHIESIARGAGCYILEVARRQFGGTYFWLEQRDQPVLVVGEPVFHVAMVTWDKTRGRLGGDAGDNIPYFYAGFRDSARKGEPGKRMLYV
jgi:hypothetical protein